MECNTGTKEPIGIDELIEKSESQKASLLVDTGNFSPKQHFIVDIYECKGYHKINAEKIINAIDSLGHSEKVLRASNALILPEVIKEFENFEKIICKKNSAMEFLETRKNSRNKNKEHARISEEYNKQRELMNELCMVTSRIRKGLNAKFFEPKNKEAYEETYKLISCLEEKMKLKNDSLYREFFNPIRDESKPQYHTDERLVATSLLLSLNSNCPVNIITADGHLQALLGSYLKIVENKDFEKYHQKINQKLEKSPIQIFFYEENTKSYMLTHVICSVQGSSREMRLFVKGTNKTLSQEETCEIRKKITSNLEKLLL